MLFGKIHRKTPVQETFLKQICRKYVCYIFKKETPVCVFSYEFLKTLWNGFLQLWTATFGLDKNLKISIISYDFAKYMTE